MTGRLRGFDGLRAIAATLIVVLHVTSATGASVHGTGARYFARLDAGVAIFFVISGFLLYRPYVQAHLADRSPGSLARFYRRRALRIYPAYWVALTAVIVIFRDAHIAGTGQYVLHYALLQIYTPKLLAGIQPAWSLAVEVSFYALLPAYAWSVARLSARRDPAAKVRFELGCAAVVFAGSLAGRAIVGAVSSPDSYRLKWLPFMADWFALGLALAAVKVAYDMGLARPALCRLVDGADRMPAALLAIAVGAFLVAAHIGLPTTFESGTVAQDVVRQFLYGTAAAALVAIAAWSVRGAGRVRAGFDARVMVLVGTISYGIFLWHDAVLAQLVRWHFAGHVGHLTTPTLFVVVFGAACALATASWIIVERPLLRTPIEGRGRVRR